MTTPSPNALPTTNRAAAHAGKRTVDIQDRPVLAPSPGQVLVKLMATGICGSDLHNWEAATLKRPGLVMGHESAGVIERVGEGVTERVVGQRVAVEPGFACMACEHCVRGRPNTCAKLKYAGMDPTDGMLCQYFTCSAGMTVPLPDSVSWEAAGAIQPLAVAVQLARRAAFNPSQTLAIFGCGPLGLLVLAVARAYGVRKVVMFDVEEGRAAFAKTYGADDAVVTPPRKQDQDSWAFAQEYASVVKTGNPDIGSGFDVTVEASGADVCAQMGIAMLKAGGTCIQAGLGKPLSQVPLFHLTANELTIKGTVRYTPGCFEDAIALVASNKINLNPLITSTYPLTRAGEAFEAQHARKDIKIIIMNQE